MDALELVNLTPLMQLSSGEPETVIGLLDGPVAASHPDFAQSFIKGAGEGGVGCTKTSSLACQHGTFTAGILSAKRDSKAPAICPGCTLLVRPIFEEAANGSAIIPSTTPANLAAAILGCVNGGARVLNLSVALAQPSLREERELEGALDHAVRRGVIVVAAAGNQAMLGSSAITRHMGVIPVAACDLRGGPLGLSNLGSSVGRRGLMAPGDGISSLAAKGEARRQGGTSVAAPFVTGTIALLCSLFPAASATEVRSAVMGEGLARRRNTVVPPLLDAWSAYQSMKRTYRA